jgi:hypothetical protein
MRKSDIIIIGALIETVIDLAWKISLTALCVHTIYFY